jgi:hypothetical protein
MPWAILFVLALVNPQGVQGKTVRIETLEVYLRVQSAVRDLQEVATQLNQDQYQVETRTLYQERLNTVVAAEQELTTTLKEMQVSQEEILRVQQHFSSQIEATPSPDSEKIEGDPVRSSPNGSSSPTEVSRAQAPLTVAAEGRGIGPRLFDNVPERPIAASDRASDPESGPPAPQEKPVIQPVPREAAFPGVGRKPIDRVPNALRAVSSPLSEVSVPTPWRWILVLVALSGLSFVLGQWIREFKPAYSSRGATQRDLGGGYGPSRQFAVRFDPRASEWILIKVLGANQPPRIVAQLRPGTVVRGVVLGKPTLLRFRLDDHRQWSVTSEGEQLIFSVTPKAV